MTFDTDIADMNLSVRTYNCLKRAGIRTMWDILAQGEDGIKKIRNIGARSYNEIADIVNKHAIVDDTQKWRKS